MSPPVDFTPNNGFYVPADQIADPFGLGASVPAAVDPNLVSAGRQAAPRVAPRPAIRPPAFVDARLFGGRATGFQPRVVRNEGDVAVTGISPVAAAIGGALYVDPAFAPLVTVVDAALEALPSYPVLYSTERENVKALLQRLAGQDSESLATLQDQIAARLRFTPNPQLADQAHALIAILFEQAYEGRTLPVAMHQGKLVAVAALTGARLAAIPTSSARPALQLITSSVK